MLNSCLIAKEQKKQQLNKCLIAEMKNLSY